MRQALLDSNNNVLTLNMAKYYQDFFKEKIYFAQIDNDGSAISKEILLTPDLRILFIEN